MGQKNSCKRLSQSVRIVQMSGQVEEYTEPVKVKQVLQKYDRHFVCSSRDLHAIATGRPLPADEDLRLGELYFLLPLSAMESEMSPKNLAALATRLLAAAKKDASKPANARVGDYKRSCSSVNEKFMSTSDNPELQIAYKEFMLSKAKSWSPRLNTIEETCLAR